MTCDEIIVSQFAGQTPLEAAAGGNVLCASWGSKASSPALPKGDFSSFYDPNGELVMSALEVPVGKRAGLRAAFQKILGNHTRLSEALIYSVTMPEAVKKAIAVSIYEKGGTVADPRMRYRNFHFVNEPPVVTGPSVVQYIKETGVQDDGGIDSWKEVCVEVNISNVLDRLFPSKTSNPGALQGTCYMLFRGDPEVIDEAVPGELVPNWEKVMRHLPAEAAHDELAALFGITRADRVQEVVPIANWWRGVVSQLPCLRRFF